MTDRPILFSGPMVRAILEGRKTQTRRLVTYPRGKLFPSHVDRWINLLMGKHWSHPRGWLRPYATTGDRLWVRETWGAIRPEGVPTVHPVAGVDRLEYRADGHPDDGRVWRPSIHMPRWASRLTLEVVSVRVERLQEISEPDAVAEGIDAATFGPVWECARDAFAHLWDSINGERASWESNPWVWRVEFRRLGDGARVSMEGV